MNSDATQTQESASGSAWQSGGFNAVLMPSRDALAMVQRRLAQDLRILPLSVEGRTLVCAAYEGTEPTAVPRLEYELNRPVRLIWATERSVMQGIHRAYSAMPAPEAEDLVSAVSQRSQRRLKPAKAVEPRTQSGSQQPMRIIAVTSGKGGVGKSTLSANLGIALSQQGLRVGLIDCDFGLSNLHVYLGVKPETSLGDVLAGKLRPEQAFVEGPEGTRLLPGASGASEMADLELKDLKEAGLDFRALQGHFDFLILDTAAGIHKGVISLLEEADDVVLVMTPDPSSVQDAYLTARLLVERRPDVRIDCIINDAQDESSSRLLFAKFQTFLASYRQAKAHYLGRVSSDQAVKKAGRTRLPVLLTDPNSKAAQDIRFLARKLSKSTAVKPEKPGLISKLFSRFAAA